MEIKYAPGATPLVKEDLEGLIPDVSTQGQLDEYEQENILEAARWAQGSTGIGSRMLTVDGLKELHRRMFERVWRWAGQFRRRDTNIGVPWHQVPECVARLCGDVQYWIDNDAFGWPERAVRFHHRLVSIHPFPNGNGRHARLATDLLLRRHGQRAFTWGGGVALGPQSRTRDAYIAALRAADGDDLAPLVAFCQGE